MQLRFLAYTFAAFLAPLTCLTAADRPLTITSQPLGSGSTNSLHLALRLDHTGDSSTEKLRLMAANGETSAQFHLGVRYYLGSNAPPSRMEAVKWWSSAAEGKHSAAAFNLGALSLQEPGATNRVQAFVWFCLAAVWGDSEAVNVLRNLTALLEPNEIIAGVGRAYAKHGKDIDLAGTLPSTRDSSVQTLLGEAYAAGAGVPQDYRIAREWFKRAATEGNRVAQSALGHMCRRGLGSPQDLREAASWYRRAAEAGEPEAAWQFSLLYEKGLGVETDKAQSLKWLRQAADAGQRDAQNRLAYMFFNGVDMEQDRTKGVGYLQKSAVAGHPQAQATLGALYSSGEGVVKDDNKALEWLTKSAQAGNSSGQFNLALLYLEGQGVKHDRVEAYKWLWLAEQQGAQTAAEAKQDLARMMSASEIAEALTRARQVADTARDTRVTRE